jgi:RNA polymerase sigma-70 factor (ECF subfamily)
MDAHPSNPSESPPVTTPEQLGPPLTPEQVFHDYAGRVFHLARRILGNDQDAEDVTQDVLLQIVRKFDTFRGEANFTTWLHRITVNAALAHRRKKAQREEHQVRDPLESFLENGAHGAPVHEWAVPPDEQMIDEETQRLIEQAIARLPESYRDIFVLADVEQLPNAEIASILGLSVSAVKSRLHRARLLMRDALAPHFEETSA